MMSLQGQRDFIAYTQDNLQKRQNIGEISPSLGEGAALRSLQQF